MQGACVCMCARAYMSICMYTCVFLHLKYYMSFLPEAIISQKYSIMIASKLSLSDLRKISIKTELAHQ